MNREGRLPLRFKFLQALYNRALVSPDTSFVDLCELLAMSNVALREGLISPSDHQTFMNLYSKVRRETGLYKVNPQPTSLYSRCLTTLFTYVYSERVEQPQFWQELAREIDTNRGYFGPGEYEMLINLLNIHSTEIDNAVYEQYEQDTSANLNIRAKNYVSYDTLNKEIKESCRFRRYLLDEERNYFLTIMELARSHGYITPAQYANLWDMLEGSTEQRRTSRTSTINFMNLSGD